MKVRRMCSYIIPQSHKCSCRHALKHLSFLFPCPFSSFSLTVSSSVLWNNTNQNIISYFFQQHNIAIATDIVSLGFFSLNKRVCIHISCWGHNTMYEMRIGHITFWSHELIFPSRIFWRGKQEFDLLKIPFNLFRCNMSWLYDSHQ